MFSRKTQKIRDLERLVRVRTAERDESRGDYKAAHADIRHLAQQLVEEQRVTRDLRARLAKSEQGRRNLLGLLAHHRDTGPYGQLKVVRARLDRALRACARYRAQIPATRPVEHSDELWSLVDWSLWGSGIGDVFREQLADQFIQAITAEQHETALRLIQAWTNSGRTPLGRRRYEDQQARLHRALRACARYRDNEAKLARHAARLQERLDHAVGLDSPALDEGALWQDRRHDKVKGVVR